MGRRRANWTKQRAERGLLICTHLHTAAIITNNHNHNQAGSGHWLLIVFFGSGLAKPAIGFRRRRDQTPPAGRHETGRPPSLLLQFVAAAVLFSIVNLLASRPSWPAKGIRSLDIAHRSSNRATSCNCGKS